MVWEISMHPRTGESVMPSGWLLLIKILAALVGVCVALDAFVDWTRGRLSMAGPIADALWMVAFLLPLPSGMLTASTLATSLDRLPSASRAGRLKSVLVTVAFFVGVLASRWLIDAAVQLAPREISKRYNAEWRIHRAQQESY